jgi:nicotinate phosphoribosyltransferase
VIINFAERAHNHNWDLDPIIRSLLDTDFYKLLMLQFIWKHFPGTQTTFALENRTSSVALGCAIPARALVEQLEHVRTLRFRPSELVWLAGNTFYGRTGIFEPGFLEWLRSEFRLSDYRLTEQQGRLSLTFSGSWMATTMWEIYALAIVSELRTRAQLRTLNELELDILYARAKTRLWNKIELLRGASGLHIADFGTRRRHSFLWQEYVVSALSEELGASFSGTSNVYLAFRHDLEAIGTNGHELPMALAAMARTDAELHASQYRVLELWQETYHGRLLILLPDTYGTTQFLAGAPEWVADWTGQRVDSKDPYVAGEEYIRWLEERGRDPRSKLLIASDALDAEEILRLHTYFEGKDGRAEGRRIRFSAGWGTLLTNDFRGCHPRGEAGFDPISLVCKLAEADGKPTVKLSDNAAKASGPPEEIERYRRVFGTAGVSSAPLIA